MTGSQKVNVFPEPVREIDRTCLSPFNIASATFDVINSGKIRTADMGGTSRFEPHSSRSAHPSIAVPDLAFIASLSPT